MAKVTITLVDQPDGQTKLEALFDPPVVRGEETNSQILAAMMLASASQVADGARRALEELHEEEG